MPKCIIDDREVSFSLGTNIIEVARSAGIVVPYFCYHPGLSVVAQCRMCSVEIEKMPKLQTACSTLAAEGMRIFTQSEKVKKTQEATMEFLLANHPLDCPICDKSGECDLQDHSFGFGSPYTRYAEDRRTYLDTDMGPVIKKNMNRCIHCTRCIRFGDEVAKIREMVAVSRGNNTEITTLHGHALETEYAGNYADICPTGSLTLKDFRFTKRVWFLKKTKTVCEGCSKGCSLELHHENGVIYRAIAAENLKVNQYWICDEGRFRYQNLMDPQRIAKPYMKTKKTAAWFEVVSDLLQSLELQKSSTFLVGSDLTLEEMQAIILFAQTHYPTATLYSYGSSVVKTSQEDKPLDAFLKRTGKTANLKGCETLGLKPFMGTEPLTEGLVLFRGGRAAIPSPLKGTLYGVGLFLESEKAAFEGILPLAGFAEKSGTVINYDGLSQQMVQAIDPVGESKPLGEILNLWSQLKTKGPTKACIGAVS